MLSTEIKLDAVTQLPSVAAGHTAIAINHASDLADYVVSALVDEATLTPKPGLVDMRGRGAHHDLSWGLLCDSAYALRPTFYAMAQAGLTIQHPQLLREKIGQLGREGEARMMAITGGTNTHRGAIWALGLLVTASAQNIHDLTPHSVAKRAALLAQLDDPFAPALTGNKGEIACHQYGVGGAKLQAKMGFPYVIDVVLPTLYHYRQPGVKESCARLNALMAVMAVLDDTCVLARAGTVALSVVQTSAQQIVMLGGVTTEQGKLAFNQLEEKMLAMHVSPGGAADMLAAALFLDRLASGLNPHTNRVG
jgi:triphosphoribosyl-dephospho-CoA synthase